MTTRNENRQSQYSGEQNDFDMNDITERAVEASNQYAHEVQFNWVTPDAATELRAIQIEIDGFLRELASGEDDPDNDYFAPAYAKDALEKGLTNDEDTSADLLTNWRQLSELMESVTRELGDAENGQAWYRITMNFHEGESVRDAIDLIRQMQLGEGGERIANEVLQDPATAITGIRQVGPAGPHNLYQDIREYYDIAEPEDDYDRVIQALMAMNHDNAVYDRAYRPIGVVYAMKLEAGTKSQQ